MKNLILIFFAILLISCKPEQKEFVILDMDKNVQNKEISLEDIGENFKWVVLESGDDILLENYIRYGISNKYIVTIGQNNIHQFDREGKYIRKLASAGKGPDEYQYISCYAIDNEKNIFYFVHSNDRDNINSINLETGEQREKIHVKEWGLPKHMTIYNNTLVCFGEPQFDKDTTYIVYILDNSGELKEHIIEIQEKEKQKQSSFSSFAPYSTYIKGNNEQIQYSKNDTIYNLKLPLPESHFALTYTNKFDIEDNPEGTIISCEFQTSDWYILRRTDINFQRGNDNDIRVTTHSQDAYLIDKESFELSGIKDIFISSLQKRYSIYNFSVSNNYILMSINAFKFQETIENLLEKEQEVSEELKNLANHLTEDDNPVLLIGELK